MTDPGAEATDMCGPKSQTGRPTRHSRRRKRERRNIQGEGIKSREEQNRGRGRGKSRIRKTPKVHGKINPYPFS